jgi:hypothetical protein
MSLGGKGLRCEAGLAPVPGKKVVEYRGYPTPFGTENPDRTTPSVVTIPAELSRHKNASGNKYSP